MFPGGSDMKKWMVVVVAVALCAAVLAAVGCGGNTSQAKTDMQTADKAYATVKTQMDALGNSLTTVLGGAVSGNFSQLTPQVLQSANAQISKILGELPAVKSDYQKIVALTGVPDYVSYANAMIKTLGLDESSLAAGQKLITDITPLVQAGNTAAVTQYFQANTATINTLQQQSTAATAAYTNAQNIKSSKNL
jgi:predicted small secreted protein